MNKLIHKIKCSRFTCCFNFCTFLSYINDLATYQSIFEEEKDRYRGNTGNTVAGVVTIPVRQPQILDTDEEETKKNITQII